MWRADQPGCGVREFSNPQNVQSHALPPPDTSTDRVTHPVTLNDDFQGAHHFRERQAGSFGLFSLE